MSRSGVLVTPDNDAAPPLQDIALSLSRQPRFGGHTIDPWSVAEHSMVVALIARALTIPENGRQVIGSRQEMYALVHDAHGSVTGDIPSTFKVPEMRALQEQLDQRIYVELGISAPDAKMIAFIKRCDREALLAEAKLCATHGVYEAIRSGIGADGELQPEASHDALVAVGEIKVHGFTQEQAAAYFYGWAKRLLERWRTA